ncbi:MAG: Rrf2 family transcriptional regulator [Richelia sp. RM2_1_2]|nr:Rrf2 family transcriptional regulator [Richelia sp. SM1_7_0]NJN07922.1 Rrf2 family transcriptional regulator [Richelia sp. RM1_1_1]NJO26711.1 Rrf2 family transcriptional regulator [Richelia sp. SL_2_1]NJO57089.1 Rrf2 family transcriptional regulator [Richelia sp. RM2_1_2]
MELSSKLQYALLALLELASSYESGQPLQIQQIADAQNIPKRYLEQLLATLRRGGLIKSTRGVKGGYVLAREPRQITVLDAVSCIEGQEALLPSTNPTSETVDGKVIQGVWQDGLQALFKVLQEHSLADLCELRRQHLPIQLMYYI